MTQHITAETRAAALAPPGSKSDTVSRSGLILGVRLFTAFMTLKALGFLISAFTFAGWRSALAAATFFILAVLGGLVLTIDCLLAERQEFYRRGQLDGWMRGWRGQEPEIDDPLLK
jgi:hypothetical protein